MSLTKQDLIELSYVVMGGILGTIGTMLIKLIIVVPDSKIMIFSGIALVGILFGLYKILKKIAKGSLILKIFKQIAKFYGLSDFK